MMANIPDQRMFHMIDVFFSLPWPPHIFQGSHGPLSDLVNFALSALRLFAYECPRSRTYSTAV